MNERRIPVPIEIEKQVQKKVESKQKRSLGNIQSNSEVWKKFKEK